MNQRFTIDQSSFEQVLCATSLIQQMNRHVRNGPDQDPPQPLSDLVEAQLAIETGTVDLEAAMNRVVGLALKLSRATGAATWLFTGHRFVYRSRTGSGANNEQLQREEPSKVASNNGPSNCSLNDLRESNHWIPAYDSIHYADSIKSWLVVPICHRRSIAGALAVFSEESNAFTERDATDARLLSGLLTHALGKAAEAELKQNVSQERATVLQAIDQLIPVLRKLAEKEKQESGRPPNRFPSLFAELESGSELTTVLARGDIPQKPGDSLPESSDSPAAVRILTDGTELNPQAIDQLIPVLRKLAEKEKQESNGSPNRLPSLFAELESGSELTMVLARADIPQEPGDGVPESSDSLAVLRIVTNGSELNSQAIDQLIPALKKLAEKEKQDSDRSPNRLSSLFTELESGSELTTVLARGDIPQEPGDGVPESSDSPTALKIVMDRTELNRLSSEILRKGKVQTRDVADNSSPAASLAPEPTRARESTCAPVPPNISMLGIGVQAAASRIQKGSPFGAAIGPTELAHRQLSTCRLWLSTSVRHTLGSLLSGATYQSRISVPAGLKVKIRILTTAAVPVAALLIALVFLFLTTTASHSSKAAVATSEQNAAAKLVSASEPSRGLDQRSGPVPVYQLTHMRVTDPAISSALSNLSRYEVDGLRRRAEYGDDSAAFLLGMAYETGHLVPQNCVKAAEWVTQSANEGDAAAQYNLGLRYGHGDGEPVNQEVGARWLRKAAARGYSQARVVLGSAH